MKRPGFDAPSVTCEQSAGYHGGEVVVGFGWWSPAEAVHEPAGVLPMDPKGGGVFEVGQGRDRSYAEGPFAADAFGFVEPHRRFGQ
jgi:hypothetical protein